jgi:hypothetical protein
MRASVTREKLPRCRHGGPLAHAGWRAGVRELHFVGGYRRNNPALIGGSDEIWKRARLYICVDIFVFSSTVYVPV